MIKVVLDEKEVKKAITYYVAKKFQINPDSVRNVDINPFEYDEVAVVNLEKDEIEELY